MVYISIIKYKYKKTGMGVVDNLGAQLEKLIRGASQGSIETKYRYIAAAERFIKFVGGHFKLKKLQNIQDKHLEAYAAHMKSRGCSDKYIKNDLSGIRYLHRQIPQARYSIKDSKTANKEMGLGSTPDGRADRAWTERELSQMKARAVSIGRYDIARTMEAIRATGMRLDEAASLRRSVVEDALKSGVLHLKNTKGGRPRDVPLSDRAVAVFNEALKNSPRGGYAFTPAGMKVHVYKKEVENFIYNHRKEIQDQERKITGHNLIPGDRGALTPHGLRHSFGREFIITRFRESLSSGMIREKAMDMARKETAEVLGHGRVEVTYIYAPANLLNSE
ncbi:site-specific integrase [Pelotomaculum terephthalicicum JT]|uniref:tyrosine-type recombinase/integrase n=1 Tax=Pelotomaculum TaxID=191373 RepID=UPI001F03860A|nr:MULTISPECIES: tyrosine-type recombinase/integrase [Pelotomaculum]MCG9969878.1 site-specific integrase [Pelotomaculum terephthalicicum JT]